MMASWPIACLHRYGFNEDMLMIETGHGCDTGQGTVPSDCIWDKLGSRLCLVAIYIWNVYRNISPHSFFSQNCLHFFSL